MRYLFGAVIVIILVAAIGSNLSGLREPTAVDWARQDAALARIQRQNEVADAALPVKVAVAVIWPIVPLVGAVGLLAYMGVLGAAHMRRVWYERTPDSRGLMPVPVEQLTLVSHAALNAYHQAQIELARRAIVPTVPHILHYTNSDQRSNMPALVEDSRVSLPGRTDLASLAYRPTLDAILLGLAEGGEHITVPARALCHVALVGATGGGKSNLMRLILPQLQAVGARVVLADPHYTPLDPETGEDWRPIEARLQLAPAVSPQDIGALLSYLTDELQRRLEHRREGRKVGPPLFLAMDELPVIADTVPSAVEHLAKLLREGRKVGLFTVGASQSMLVKVVGGDSSAREAYRTAYYVGGDLKSAAALLDMPQRSIDEGACGGGVAYLRSIATAPARLVRVPYVSNAALSGLLATSIPTSNSGEVEVGMEVGMEVTTRGPLPTHQDAGKWTAQEAAILDALKAGKTVGELATDIAGAKGGRKYQEANRFVTDVIRRAL